MAAEKMSLEGDNSYGFKRGIGIDYFGGAPGITTIRFDGDLTLSDFKIRLEGGDLVFYLIDPANPNQPLNEIADVFYFDNWIAGDHGIEQFEFADGTSLSKIAVQSNGRLKLYGTDGDDAFIGTSDRDEIYGSEGADTIDGKGGTDIVNYLLSDAGVTVNLATGEGSGGHAEGDQISNVESIIGSYHDDVLIGDDGNNNLFAQNGNDHLEGGAGDDWLNAYGSGADYLDGGSGNDTVRYRWSGSAVTVDLTNQTNNAGDASGDVYVSIENVMGSNSYGDHITGDAGDNKIWGYGGNDTLEGGDGNDTLLGGNGNDILKAGNGDDYLDGGAGDDEFHYGEGVTTFRYDLGDGNDTIHVNHDVDSSYNDKIVFGPGISPDEITVTRQGEGTDKYGTERNDLDLLLTFKDGSTLLVKEAFYYGPNGFAFGELQFADGTVWNWESFNKMRFENASDDAEELVGTLSDDVINGLGGDDKIDGYSGDDYLIGGAGNDTLQGHDGDDHLEGGTGDDKLSSSAGNNILDGGDGNDTFFSITYGEDQIIGGSGDDTIYAVTGTSVITGGEGDDTINVSSAEVTVHYDLGDGNDIVDLWYPEKPIHKNQKVVFGSGISPDEITVTRVGEGTDAFGKSRDDLDLLLTFKDGGTLLIKNAFYFGASHLNFSEFQFSDGTVWNWENFNKMLYENASDADERFVGTLGDDTIYGLGGDDVIIGLSGDDHLIGGEGNDDLFGAEGNDHLEGGAGDDKLEGWLGNSILDGGDGDDTIFSTTDGVDQIFGGSGDDTIFVRYGSAVVTAGTGDDTLDISLADVTLYYNLGDGNDVVDFWYPEKLKDENHKLVLGEGISPDEVVVTRTSVSSTSLLLTFKDGGTLLLGEVMDRYTLRSDFGEIEFADGTVWNWENINQKLQEHIGDGNDVVGGTSGNDIIDGMGGDDTIYGEAGDDTLSGGDGNDDLKGGAGNDQLSSGKGDDYLDGGDGDDVLTANGTGSAQLHGGNGDDTLYHIQGSSILNGGNGDDTIHYFGGDITVDYGVGSGDDIIRAGGLAGPNNKLMIVGAKPDEVLLRHAGSDSIEFTFSDGGTLLLEDGFFQSSEKLLFSEIQFLDGTVWTWDDVNQKLIDSAAAHAVDHGATEGNDTINGTVDGDIIKGLAGDDVIDGGAGRDFIFAGDGNDTIKGGDGKDILSGGDGNDHISGESGDDDINGGAGDDQIFGGEGNDYLSGGEGDDILKGGAGNDQLSGGPGNDTLDGGDGDDVISAYHDGDSTLIGGAGNDKFYTLPSPTLSNFVKVEGGSGDDVLEYIGGEVSFHYDLGDGNDTIRTASVLNPHSKIVFGEGISPDEVMIERQGNTQSNWSGLQYTFKDGGSIVITTAFTDTPGKLQFGEIQFADGTVWNWEDIHQKLLENASDESEILWGTNGDDVINGLGGDDVIDSVEGDNQITGGAGNDIITSGYGDDTIIFGENFGNDTLIDFHFGEGSRDTIQFTDGVFESFEDVMSAARQDGLDTVIQLDEDNSITLQHVDVSHLHADDFAFVS
ncbi:MULTISPECIES: calcium-binding protein [unclassified Pseudovibrio]|uniref:calcium-binding protein n=1 Tax=unclassified Pseudovibrio TaxID=2627060 RepID=UPI0007AE5BAF|nr:MULTISPECIES: calcium-binding protein [unclassified Pseudovibrio]KZK94256.1 Bifunctional hemolysin/adenylate cyclase precursor [Pseudovibrio sp. W74]KZL09928.1 Bifunctional hemolysin/adenylate cyclase precursor [Pseudovibrio sp. Ad14]